MIKRLTVLALVLLTVSVPLSALADSGNLKALEAKTSALLNDGRLTIQAAEYNYAAVFAYADTANEWWCGLAVTSLASTTNTFMIGAFDSTGAAVASGEFVLEENAQKVDLIQNFMDVGEITGRISIAIFGSGSFMADRFQGNDQGGFGEIEKEATLY